MTVDDARLDVARRTGDAPADDVVRAVFADRTDPADAFRLLVALHGHPDAGAEPGAPALRAWFEDTDVLPGWADLDRCNRGTDFFNQWGLEIGLGLFLAALPEAYAAEPGVPVLALTGRLETDTKRRILETAQLVLDMGRRDTLLPGGHAHATLRHVRLMHAGVRHLITTDQRISPPGDPSGARFHWEEHWGVPVNQEHLAGTLVSFSFAMLEVLDAMGLDYDHAAAEDYLHLWAVAGHLIGVEDDLIPGSRGEWAALSELIKARNHAPSRFGTDLTRALLEVVQGYVPRPGRGLVPATMRSMIGDEIADMLDVPPAGLSRFALLGIRGALRTSTLEANHTALGRWLTRKLSSLVLNGFVVAQRPGRPAFAIPDSLAPDTAAVWRRRRHRPR